MLAKIEGTLPPKEYLDQIDSIDKARRQILNSPWREVSTLRLRVYPANNYYSVEAETLGIYEVNVKNGVIFAIKVATDGLFAVGAEPPLLGDVGAFLLWTYKIEESDTGWALWDPGRKLWVGTEKHFMTAMRLIMQAFLK